MYPKASPAAAGEAVGLGFTSSDSTHGGLQTAAGGFFSRLTWMAVIVTLWLWLT